MSVSGTYVKSTGARWICKGAPGCTTRKDTRRRIDGKITPVCPEHDSTVLATRVVAKMAANVAVAGDNASAYLDASTAERADWDRAVKDWAASLLWEPSATTGEIRWTAAERSAQGRLGEFAREQTVQALTDKIVRQFVGNVHADAVRVYPAMPTADDITERGEKAFAAAMRTMIDLASGEFREIAASHVLGSVDDTPESAQDDTDGLGFDRDALLSLGEVDAELLRAASCGEIEITDGIRRLALRYLTIKAS